jgi:hypothetical protein
VSNGRNWNYFTSQVVLTINTWYRLTLLPQTTTDIIMRRVTVLNGEYFKMMGGGADMYACTKASGTFTDSVLDRMMLSPLIDQFESGGGSGILVPGGMTGGMNRAA